MPKIALNHADAAVTCYLKEGVVSAVLCVVLALATNVGDGGYTYFM